MKLERIVLATQFDPTRLVTSHEIFSKSTKSINQDGVAVEEKQFADNSLFSKRIFGDMDTKEEFSCQCGKLYGKFYEGTICPKCKTEVSFIGLNINKYGWIDLSLSKYDEDGNLVEAGKNGCHVIEYIPYYQLEKIIGVQNLKNIISVRNTVTITGELDTKEVEELRAQSPEAKYWYIGIEEFYEKYNEVLDYYYNLKELKKYKKLYEFLRNKAEVFTDKIPVISIILRPAMRTADGLKLDDINIKYQNILKNLEMLQEIQLIKIIKDAIVEQIQAEFMLLSEEILEAIKGKAGIIRNQICGTRVNFSARNIISPAHSGIKLDEMVVPYSTFLELYKFEIINILKTINNISFKAAEKIWYNAELKFDKNVYKIMCKMIKDSEVGVLLNRKWIAA